jgi:D-aminopeptidase
MPPMNDLDHLLLRRRVERLLTPWRQSDGPGVTLGVVVGRDLVVHESAGMASIELGVPIGPQTTFRIASVSKQFTCTAILLLEAKVGCRSMMMCGATFLPCPISVTGSRLHT